MVRRSAGRRRLNRDRTRSPRNTKNADRFDQSNAGFDFLMTEGLANDSVSHEPATTSTKNLTPSHLVTALQRAHPDWITDVIQAFGEVTAIVPREHIVDVSSFLKTSPDAKFD